MIDIDDTRHVGGVTDDVARHFRSADCVDVLVHYRVGLPGAGNDITRGIDREDTVDAIGLQALLRPAHRQGRKRIGGADTHEPGLLIDHERSAVGRFNMEQPLRVFRPDTDVTDRGEKVFPLFGGDNTFSRHVQVLRAVVLQVPVTVFRPHPEQVAFSREKPGHDNAVFATDTFVDLRLPVLARVVVLPLFYVPVLDVVEVHHHRHRR